MSDIISAYLQQGNRSGWAQGFTPQPVMPGAVPRIPSRSGVPGVMPGAAAPRNMAGAVHMPNQVSYGSAVAPSLGRIGAVPPAPTGVAVPTQSQLAALTRPTAGTGQYIYDDPAMNARLQQNPNLFAGYVPGPLMPVAATNPGMLAPNRLGAQQTLLNQMRAPLWWM